MNAENKNKLLEELEEDARVAKKHADSYQRLYEYTEQIKKLAAKDDMAGISDIIAKHNSGELALHSIIGSTSLRSNKEFMTALVEYIIDGAQEVSPDPNYVNFTYKGFAAKFNFLENTSFDFASTDEFYPRAVFFSRNLKADCDHRELQYVNEFDTLCSNYKILVDEGLIAEDFSFAGDETSNDQSKKYFELSTWVFDETAKKDLPPLHALSNAAAQRDFKNISGRDTKFWNLVANIRNIKKLVCDLEELLAKLEEYDCAADEFTKKALDKGYEVNITPDTTVFTSASNWTEISTKEKDGFIKNSRKQIERAKKVIEKWEQANFYQDYLAYCKKREATKEE